MWDDGDAGHKAISLTQIPTKASAMSYPVPTTPPKAGDILAQGPWSITFCIKPSNTGTTWSADTHGNGPVLHGIDNTGAPWGVSVLTRQHNGNPAAANTYYNYRIVVHHKNTAASGQYHATWTNGASMQLKANWMQVTVVKPLDGTPLVYIDGVALPTETNGDLLYGGSYNNYPLNNDASYLAGQVGMPRLAKGLGTGTDANPLATGSTYYARYRNQIVIGAALHGVPFAFSPGTIWAGSKELSDYNTITGNAHNYHLIWGRNNGSNQGGSQTAGGSANSHKRTYLKARLAELGLWTKALSVSEAGTLGQKNWGY